MPIPTALSASILTAATALLVACGNPASAPDLIANGRQALAEGDHAAALIHFKNAVQADPDNGEAHLQLANAYVAEKDYQTAEREFLRARALKIPEDRIAPELARSFLEMGNFQKLLDEVDARAVESSDGRASVYAARALAQLGISKRDAAKSELAKAEALHADQADVVLAKARYEASAGHTDQALLIVDQLLAGDGKNVEAWLFKAELLNALGKADDAITAFERVLSLEPNTYRAQALLAELFLRKNDISSAKPYVAKAVRLAPDAINTHWVKAMLAMAEKDYVSAAQEAHAVLTKTPNHLPSLRLSALANLQLGNTSEAPEALSALLSQRPDDPVALALMVEVQLGLNQPRNAQKYLDKLDVENSHDAKLLLLAGQVALALGDSERAHRYVRQVEEINPDDTQTKIDLALFDLNAGNSEHGIASLEQLASAHDSSQAGELVVLAQLRNKRFDEALAAIDRLAGKRPNDAWVEHLRGMAHLGKGEKVKARESFERAYALKDNISQSMLVLARMDIEAGKTGDARARIEKFLVKSPRDTFALLALADMDAAAGDDRAYLDGLAKVSSVDPKNLASPVLATRYWLAKNNPAKALVTARAAFEIAPDNNMVRMLLANTQAAAGETENALVTYRDLVAAAPDMVDAHLGMAQTHITLKEMSKARSEITTALKLAPDNIRAHELFGRIDLLEGNAKQAMATAKNLRETHPDSEVGLVLAGDIYMSTGQYTSAVEQYRQAFAQVPSSAILVRMAQSMDATGKTEEAKRQMVAWIDANPTDNAVRQLLANHAMNAGDFSLAAQQYESLLAATPNDWALMNNLAWAYHETGNDKGLEYARKVYALEPDRAVVLDTYGWILTQRGDLKEGLEILWRARTKDLEDGDIHYHLAYALYKNGEPNSARRELESLLAKQQDFSEAAQARALLAKLK